MQLVIDVYIRDKKITNTSWSEYTKSPTKKSLQSSHSPIDGITPRNDLVDEYIHNTQEVRVTQGKSSHQQCRVEWVQSEISKIAAGGSFSYSRRIIGRTYS
jgi:hypothetical protein